MNNSGGAFYGDVANVGEIAKITFTTPSTFGSNAYMGMYPRTGSTNVVFANNLLVEGDQALPYVPYGNNCVNVKVIGENLWSSEWEQGSISGTNGTNITANSYVRTKGYIYTIPNKHYAISRSIHTSYIQIRGYDINKNFIGTGSQVVQLVQGNTADNPMNLESSCVIYTKPDIFYLRFVDTSGDSSTKYMMVQGDVPSDYKPYQEKNIPIPLNNNELVGIGTYKDELLVDKNGNVFINKKTNKVVIDGINIKTAYKSNTYQSYLIGVPGGVISGAGLCSHTKNIVSQNSAVYDNYIAIENGGQLWFKGANVESIEDMNNWFINNNVIVYRVLVTPELIDLNYDVDIKLFDGVNHISNSEDADMEITYVKDINIVINKLTNAIIEIGGE